MSLVIRHPETADADGLGRVHVRAWQVAYSGLMSDDYLRSLSMSERSATWRDSLSSQPGSRRTRLVAVDDGVVIGFAVAGPAGGDDHADRGELYAINVDPDRWGDGVGRTLIASALGALRRDGFESAVLWVHPANERARRFYSSGGWVDDGIERHEEVLGIEVPEVRLSLDLRT